MTQLASPPVTRPRTELELLCERIAHFVRAYGGEPPDARHGPSIKMVADFAYAAGLELRVQLFNDPLVRARMGEEAGLRTPASANRLLE